MPRMASIEQMSEFWTRCLVALDSQVEPLPSEAAKKMAIQAVQRTLGSYLRDEDGEKLVLSIIAYCKHDTFNANTPSGSMVYDNDQDM